MRHPLHQVDLNYHVGTLKEEMVHWALIYMTSRSIGAKKLEAEKVMRAYGTMRTVEEEVRLAKRAWEMALCRRRRAKRFRSNEGKPALNRFPELGLTIAEIAQRGKRQMVPNTTRTDT